MEQIVKSEENLSRAKALEVHQEPPPPRKCPRCDSFNTKFCYYNNYSHAQPRYLCKACRRYWTHGGSLRNVPIGGACRKNRRLKNVISEVAASTSSAISTAQSLPNESQNYQGLPTRNSQVPYTVNDGERFGGNVQEFNQNLIPVPIMPLNSWSINVGFGGAANESYSFWNATTNNIIGSSTAELDFSSNLNPWFNH